MIRFWPLLPLSFLLVSGCRIEQTPSDYIDRLQTPEAEMSASVEELTDRVQSTVPSLQRGDIGDVLAALTPHSELATYGPAADSALTNSTDIGLLLGNLTEGSALSMDDLVVGVGQGNNVAWFRTTYLVADTADLVERVHFSGVFVRLEGEWRLRQGHISTPAIPAPPPAEADTLAEAG